jgi:hypothetical protein
MTNGLRFIEMVTSSPAAETRWPRSRPGSLEPSTLTLLPAARHFPERDSLFVCERTGDPVALDVERIVTASVLG